jgi:hypothetical protein
MEEVIYTLVRLEKAIQALTRGGSKFKLKSRKIRLRLGLAQAKMSRVEPKPLINFGNPKGCGGLYLV